MKHRSAERIIPIAFAALYASSAGTALADQEYEWSSDWGRVCPTDVVVTDPLNDFEYEIHGDPDNYINREPDLAFFSASFLNSTGHRTDAPDGFLIRAKALCWSDEQRQGDAVEVETAWGSRARGECPADHPWIGLADNGESGPGEPQVMCQIKRASE